MLEGTGRQISRLLPLRNSGTSRRRAIPGAPPGLLEEGAAVSRAPARLTAIEYCAERATTITGTLADLAPPTTEGMRLWVHFTGTPRSSELQSLGERFGLHTLALEDVANAGQRAKLDWYDNHAFLVVHLPCLRDGVLRLEQVSVFLGTNFVISVHDSEQDRFEPIRDRLHRGVTGRLRRLGSDYLLYALLDLVVDTAYPLLETLGEQLDSLEERIIEQPEPEMMGGIHDIRQALVSLRRALWPQRETIGLMVREPEHGISEETLPFLRDCYDHSTQVLELLETYREMASGLQELYLSSLSFKMNEIMQTLTIIATIFIPLSFLAGVYGMNFDTHVSPWNMPELETRYGYPLFLVACVAIAGGLLLWFRRRGWF